MASIVDRGKGRPKRWQVRYRVGDETQRSQSFRTLDEARAFMARVDIDLRGGTYIDPHDARLPFGDWAEHVLASWEHTLKPTSYARARTVLDCQILPFWEGTHLGRIDHLGLQAWVHRLNQALAPPTVHKAVQTMAKILRAAVTARKIPHNPAEGLELPRIEKHEARFLEPADVKRLAGAMPDEYRAFVYLGAVCGLRAGELFGLRWGDIDMLRRTVEIRQIVTEANGRQHIGSPKTAAARRRVPMPDVMVNELARHAATHRARLDPTEYVFPTPGGKPWRATNFRNRIWRPGVAVAGLDGLVIHELRHSAVAAWIEAGAEPTEVAARAGHRSVVTIYDRYGHRFPAQADRVNAALDALYRETG